VVLPLLQGTVWSLVLFGWKHWNRASQFSGASIGAQIRRWWWGVNNWGLPNQKRSLGRSTRQVGYELKLEEGKADLLHSTICDDARSELNLGMVCRLDLLFLHLWRLGKHIEGFPVQERTGKRSRIIITIKSFSNNQLSMQDALY
jgi:hypothetical protein